MIKNHINNFISRLKNNPVIEKFPEITKLLNDLIDDGQFKEVLDKAGTIGSLFNIGIYIFEKLSDNLPGGDKKNFAILMKITINAAEESIEDLVSIDKQKEIKIKDLETEEIINDLFEIFKSTTVWNNNPADHPIIERFRNKIVEYMKTANLINEIPEFVSKFNTKIYYNVKNSLELKPYLVNWKLIDKSFKRLEYLEDLKANLDKINTIDKKRSSEYYIKNDFVKLEDSETWNLDDYNIEEKYSENEKWNLDDFLKSGYRKVVIAASFGMGKTSFAKHIAIDYAKQHLNGQTTYIPIFVSLKNNLRNVYKDYTLERLVNRVISPSEDEKIILICDGLDEYDGDKVKKIEELEEITDKFPDTEFKIIITTRLIPNFHIDFNLKSLEYGYIRLLPFKTEQVNQFYSSAKYNLPSVSYETLKENGLQDQEIRKPLFCWMYAITYQQQDKYNTAKITITNDLELSKTILYFNFIHSIIKGKYSESEDPKIKYEKWILRKIAALKMMYKDKLYESNLRDKLEKFIDTEDQNNPALNRFLQNTQNNNENLIDPILTSYLRSEVSNYIIDFIHKSFLDYLIAEYYIESLLVNKPYRLNVGTPTYETITFMKSLLEIIKNYDNTPMNSISNQFLKSVFLKYDENIIISNEEKENIIEKLVNNSREIFYDNKVINHKDHLKEQKELWDIYEIPHYQSYRDLMIHKQLSLFVLKKVFFKSGRIDKHKLLLFIKNLSFQIPYYLKDFSNADLSNADLSNADLSNADLSGTNLFGTNLFGTNLSGTNLSRANLSNANLSRANLYSANLSGTNLSGTNLSNANLSAYLSNANLSNANLSNANLSNANLSNANLSNTYLSGANLSSADLTGTSLAYSIIISPSQYDKLKINNATCFNATITNEEKLVKLLTDNTKKITCIKIEYIKDLEIYMQKSKFQQYKIDYIINLNVQKAFILE